MKVEELIEQLQEIAKENPKAVIKVKNDDAYFEPLFDVEFFKNENTVYLE